MIIDAASLVIDNILTSEYMYIGTLITTSEYMDIETLIITSKYMYIETLIITSNACTLKL